MTTLKQQKFIYGAIFLLANKLQLLGDQADATISTKQYFFLVTLSQFGKHSPTLTAISEFMACSRQNSKKIAQILEEKGMIVMKKDTQDQRSYCLSLTHEGREYITAREMIEQEFYDTLFDNIGELQMDYLEMGLLKLAESLARLEAKRDNRYDLESDEK